MDQESKRTAQKIFLLLFLVAVFPLVVANVLPEGIIWRVGGVIVGALFLGVAQFLGMQNVFNLVQSRVTSTERVLEANYSRELQEYTKRLEMETEKLQETSNFLTSILDISTKYSSSRLVKTAKLLFLTKAQSG